MTARREGPIGASISPPVGFSIDVEPQRDTVQIAPRGELDLGTVEQLQRQLGELIEAGFERLVIDLRGVEFLDSTALHALFDLHAKAQRDGWVLAIIPGAPSVQRVFEITGTSDHLPFVDKTITTRSRRSQQIPVSRRRRA